MEAEDEVTNLLLSGDKNFASEIISRENFFLIGTNIKYGRAATVNCRYITRKYLVIIFSNTKYLVIFSCNISYNIYNIYVIFS